MTSPAARVRLIQGALDARGPFTDLVRADGKRVKEAVQDLAGGRLILERASDVVMGLWPGHRSRSANCGRTSTRPSTSSTPATPSACSTAGTSCCTPPACRAPAGHVVLAGPPGAGKSSAALHLLEGEMRALVLLRWRRDGAGLHVDRLAPAAALHRLEVYRKDLGAFDLDRPAGAPVTEPELGGLSRAGRRRARSRGHRSRRLPGPRRRRRHAPVRLIRSPARASPKIYGGVIIP